MGDLAIHGGTPTRTERFPPWPDFDDSQRSNLLVDALPVPVDVELGVGGEGGALVSADPEVRARAMSFSDCGRRPGDECARSHAERSHDVRNAVREHRGSSDQPPADRKRGNAERCRHQPE